AFNAVTTITTSSGAAVRSMAAKKFRNYLLIYGNWGLPRLELVGAGVASSLSHLVGFAMLAAYARFEPTARRFQLFREVFTPHWGRLREVAKLAWPIGLTVAFEAMLFNASVLLMGRIGVIELAAHQIALNVASLAFMAPLGMSIAGGVRVGLMAGAGDRAGVRRAAATSICVCVVVMAVLAAPGLLAPYWLAGLYLSDGSDGAAAVRALAAAFLPIAAAFALFDAVQVAAAQALRGLKDVRVPLVLTAISYWAIGFPAAAWLGLGTSFGAMGVWVGLLIALAVASVLLGGRLWLLVREPRATTPTSSTGLAETRAGS
ncbi:MAG: MATE family efflux transporter, partial [Pseudomonadota bacterium]